MEKIEFITSDNDIQEFYVIEETVLNNITYLLVSEGNPDSDDVDAFILKEVSEQNGDVMYDLVEDERELAALSGIFNELLSEDDIILE